MKMPGFTAENSLDNTIYLYEATPKPSEYQAVVPAGFCSVNCPNGSFSSISCTNCGCWCSSSGMAQCACGV